jgi:hypothetical protein
MAIWSFSTSARNALSRSVAAKALRRSASRSGGVPGGAPTIRPANQRRDDLHVGRIGIGIAQVTTGYTPKSLV